MSTSPTDDLERQLTARTEDLAVMNMTVQSQVQHLRASERDLREVEAGIVAQLAAPTRALETYGVLLERGVAAPEVVAAWRDETGQAQRRLQRGIDGLLRFTKVTTSGGAFGHVDLNDVIDEALEHLEPQLIEAQAEVDVAELPTVAGDREQLRQVMIQLIANALGHRRDDVRMSIKVSWSAQQWRDVATDNVAPADEFVQIEFEDNGSGFAPEDAERIFGLFTHLVDSGAGEGVGLAYCRRVVERHGGTLSARGRPGQGAHFVMTLPRRLAIARV